MKSLGRLTSLIASFLAKELILSSFLANYKLLANTFMSQITTNLQPNQFTLFDENDNQLILTLKSPLMRGYAGANILSKIKDLVMGLPTTKLLTSQDEVAKAIRDYQFKINDLKQKSESEDRNIASKAKSELDIVNSEFESYSSNNLEAILKLQGGLDSQYLKLAYDLLQEIIDYYQLTDELGNSKNYQETDIMAIIKFISSEPRNNLSNFLNFIP
ncbi:MAG: hypothetical protein ACRCZ2_10065 [Fusobacteriaceae bacterium]